MAPTKANSGIRLTVEWLETHGFNVVESGDGKQQTPEDPDVAFASMELSDPTQLVVETRRLHTLLISRGIQITSDLEDDVSPCLCASFEPASNCAIIDLVNVDDDLMFRSLS